MKKVMTFFGALLIATVFLISCGQSLPENQFLGKIPGKAKEHNEGRERLLEEEANATNFEKKTELREKRSEHGREWIDWLEGYANSGGLQPTIPHEVEGDFSYTVNEVSLGVNRANVELIFTVTTKETLKVTLPRQRVRLYFVGLDSEKQPIVVSAVPARMYDVREEISAGSELKIKGVWTQDHLIFLEDLAMIRIISGDQYAEFDKEKRRIRRSL